MLYIYFELSFESLIFWLDLWLSSLLVAFISLCFSSLKNSFSSSSTALRQILDRFSTDSVLFFKTPFLCPFLIDPWQILDPSRNFPVLFAFSIASQYIEVLWFLLNRISTASQSIEISVLLLDTFSTASSIYETNFYALCLLDRFSIHWDTLFSVNRSSVAPR